MWVVLCGVWALAKWLHYSHCKTNIVHIYFIILQSVCSRPQVCWSAVITTSRDVRFYTWNFYAALNIFRHIFIFIPRRTTASGKRRGEDYIWRMVICGIWWQKIKRLCYFRDLSNGLSQQEKFKVNVENLGQTRSLFVRILIYHHHQPESGTFTIRHKVLVLTMKSILTVSKTARYLVKSFSSQLHQQ